MLTLHLKDAKLAKEFRDKQAKKVKFWGAVICFWFALANINLVTTVLKTEQYFRLMNLTFWIPMILCLLTLKVTNYGISFFAGFLFCWRMVMTFLVNYYYLKEFEDYDEGEKIMHLFQPSFFLLNYLIYSFFCTVDWFYGSLCFGAPIYVAY
jgi:hypothetical protein